MRTLIAATLILIAVSTVEASRPSPLPSEQWNPATHVWLARGMVAEAGWLAEKDHIAIAFVLSRRWKTRIKKYPTIRFIDVIRAYCAGLEPALHSPTLRQRWLRSLSFDISEPNSWPRKASWKKHLPLWRKALQRSHDWYHGKYRDPCRGRAWHWGGYIDPPKEGMIPVECGETRNTFYGLKQTRQGGSGDETEQEEGEEEGSEGGRVVRHEDPVEERTSDSG